MNHHMFADLLHCLALYCWSLWSNAYWLVNQSPRRHLMFQPLRCGSSKVEHPFSSLVTPSHSRKEHRPCLPPRVLQIRRWGYHNQPIGEGCKQGIKLWTEVPTITLKGKAINRGASGISALMNSSLYDWCQFVFFDIQGTGTYRSEFLPIFPRLDPNLRAAVIVHVLNSQSLDSLFHFGRLVELSWG